MPHAGPRAAQTAGLKHEATSFGLAGFGRLLGVCAMTANARAESIVNCYNVAQCTINKGPAMTDNANPSHFIPDGWHTVTPRIVVHDAQNFVQFLRQVFGATGDYRHDSPSVIRIGDSVIMVSEVGMRGPTTAFLYIYVADTDATHRLAIDAGARALEAPFDTPYGDRRCMVEDKWGNTWQIATHKEAGEAA